MDNWYISLLACIKSHSALKIYAYFTYVNMISVTAAELVGTKTIFTLCVNIISAVKLKWSFWTWL